MECPIVSGGAQPGRASREARDKELVSAGPEAQADPEIRGDPSIRGGNGPSRVTIRGVWSVTELCLRARLVLSRSRPTGGVAGLVTSSLVFSMFPSAATGHAPVEVIESPEDVGEKNEEQNPVRIYINPSITDASFIVRWIHERSSDIHRRFPDAPDHEQWIWVEINGVTYDYRVQVVAMRDGDPVEGEVDVVACECTGDELLGVIDAEIRRAVEQLESSSHQEDEVDVHDVRVADEPELDPGHVEPMPAEAPRRLGALGYTGIGLTMLGIVGVGVGVPISRRVDDENIQMRDAGFGVFETKAIGIVVGSIGGAALLSGISMLTADLVRTRRSIVVVPSAGTQGGGIYLRMKL